MAELNGSAKYSVVRDGKQTFPSDTKKSSGGCCHPAFRILGIVLLVVVFVLSVTGACFFWTTDKFNEMVLENLVLKNNTQTFQWWQVPPVQPYMRVHVFNYTNLEAFMAGREKPFVQDVGPYTFRQTMEKVDVVFNDNGTVSYREKISFEFAPELSVSDGKDDRVTVINMPLLSAIALMGQKNIFQQSAMALAIRTINSKPFLNLSASEFMWGYKEALTTLAKVFSSLNVDPESLKLGILEARDGVTRTTVTVETGAKDMDRLGLITRVGGRERLDAWGDTNCSRMDGSDGTMFPPKLVQNRSRLHIFNKDMCRRLPIEFRDEVEIRGDIPAYRYQPPANVFDTPAQNPDNECFCPEERGEKCLPGGVFSVAPCTFGAPIMVSFPHFFQGDSELYDHVDGLQPNASKHSMYLYLHPILGIPMGGQSRFQFNIQIHKSPHLAVDDFLEDGSILPIAWLEIGVDELPPEIRDVFYRATFTTLSIERGLKYGLLVLAFITGLVLLRCACHRFVSRRRHSTSKSDKYVMEPL